jgi:hypothetical protein
MLLFTKMLSGSYQIVALSGHSPAMMTVRVLLQNWETGTFFQGGIAWTKNIDRAFDFQTVEAAQQFWRENELVRVRTTFRCERKPRTSNPRTSDSRGKEELA